MFRKDKANLESKEKKRKETQAQHNLLFVNAISGWKKRTDFSL